MEVSSIWENCERPNLGGLVLVVVVDIGVPAVDVELVLVFKGCHGEKYNAIHLKAVHPSEVAETSRSAKHCLVCGGGSGKSELTRWSIPDID